MTTDQLFADRYRLERRLGVGGMSTVQLAFDTRLTFVLGPVYIGAIALTAFAIWQITLDGEAVAFEGLALVALYTIVAVLAWFE